MNLKGSGKEVVVAYFQDNVRSLFWRDEVNRDQQCGGSVFSAEIRTKFLPKTNLKHHCFSQPVR
jgi:hypothetical protein